jgi:hypothetical protein
LKHVKKQHIVPEFLLKNFSSKEQTHIWSFDKSAINERWNNEKYRAISSAPTEDYFYDKTIGVEHGSYEYVLRNNETIVAPIINRLIGCRDLNGLSEEDKSNIALFLCFQMFRTKGHLELTENILNQFNKPVEDYIGHKIDVNYRKVWLENLEMVNTYKQFILDKTWILAESNDEFYLSDNPVVFQNIAHRRKNRGNLGINSLGVEIYLPLSSSVVLGLFCNKTVPDTKPNIKCLPGNIENLNWLQVIYSTKFVFSKTNNFELINKMIDEKEL